MMGVMEGNGYSLSAETLPYEDDREAPPDAVEGPGEVEDPVDEIMLTVKTLVKRKDLLSSPESCIGRGCTLTEVPL